MSNKRNLLTKEQAAERLNISVLTMNKARSTGHPNIPYIKIGKTVRYDPDALDAYLEQHSHNSVEVAT